MQQPPDAAAPGAGALGVIDWSESESRALLASIVESSDDAIISKTLDGTVTSWNGAARRIFGYSAEEMLGENILKLIPSGREGEELYIIERIRRGERVDRFDTIRQHKNGKPIAVTLTVAPVHAADGSFIGVSTIARDVTERKRLEEAQRLLDREINHRSKNLLAVVDAIIRQTVAHSSTDDFTRRITQRLRALSANQDLLIESSWRGAEMRELVYSQLVHIEGLLNSRVMLSGEPLVVTPMAAQALGMAFHELAINAVTYGALSSPEGGVEIAWRLEPTSTGPELVASWREAGGPVVSTPDRAGFGTTIIERITGQALGGQVAMTYAPTGLIWELRAPATALISVATELLSPAPAMDVAGK